jgi:hypothetical protein
MTYRKAFYHVSRKNLIRPLSGVLGDVNAPQDDNDSYRANSPQDAKNQELKLPLELPLRRQDEVTISVAKAKLSTADPPIPESNASRDLVVSNGSVSSSETADGLQADPQVEEVPSHLQPEPSGDSEILLIDFSAVDSEKPISSPPVLSRVLLNELMEIQPGWTSSNTINDVVNISPKPTDMEIELRRPVQAIQNSISNDFLGELDAKLNDILKGIPRSPLNVAVSELKSEELAYSLSQKYALVGQYELLSFIHKNASSSVFVAQKVGRTDRVCRYLPSKLILY